MRNLVWVVLAVAVCGCKPTAPDSIPASTVQQKVQDPTDPVEKVYEQVRSGAFQYGSVVDSLGEALQRVTDRKAKATGPEKEALSQISEALDSAGASLEDFQEAPPEKKEFDKDFKAQDDKRLKAIDAGNDALHNVNEALDMLDGYEEQNKKPLDEELAKMLDLIDQDLTEAIQTYGGKVETDDQTPVSS